MRDFSWQPEFKSGISVLDKQYKKAFELFNQLSSAITFRDASHLEQIARKIYNQFHQIYNYEQPLLDNKSKEAAEKCQSFARLLDRIDTLIAEMINGDKLTAARKLHYEIKSWFKSYLTPIPYYHTKPVNKFASPWQRLSEWFSVKSAKQ